ncbi:TIGR02147 family protein [Bdellovibrio bacteriovorus]|uniref:HTH cro/C1-type domain-containing protein n=1 Tax=Bdellovibrio bacteriovorus TaxID=959 RepID=A0A1Z3N717_BDEBC|nr:TIGR02147 family protein [Bdellovibrio bacteriovorus]ASD63237.1 hypothetical protein B9G79_06475 [Bdellovibrio bacteriovorus]
MDTLEYLDKVRLELKTRRISQRGLALRAKIPPGRVSEILQGRRPLTVYYANKIALALNITPPESLMKAGTANPTRPDRVLSEDELQVIQNWYHLAILNLIKTDGGHRNPAWFAQRLGITEKDVYQALRRMLRLRLIVQEESGYRRTSGFVTTSAQIPSATLRNMHHQMMEQSQKALQKVPVEFRDISHMVMAINPDKLPEAKEEIRLFRRKMAALLEETAPATEVYLLGLQLVPLSKITEASK